MFHKFKLIKLRNIMIFLLCRISGEDIGTSSQFISSIFNRETSERPSARNCLSADFLMSVYLKPLQLPWDKPIWKIHVSKVNSTHDIRGYLFDDNLIIIELKKYEEMLSNGQAELMTAKKIQIGKYFLTSYLDDGHLHIRRIRVLDIDEMNREAHSLSIDFGMEEWLSYDQIYEADPALLRIPAQVIRFSLDGFDEN